MNDELGNRMKSNYENVTRNYLTRRMPVIIRLDGRAFHTFTKGFDKPFDSILTEAIQYTTEELCKNIQGCVFGYCQSDEISLLLIDYKKLNSSAWFDYNIQKCSSVVASMATNYFNNYLFDAYNSSDSYVHEYNYYKMLENKIFKASFDARCFNIPKEEVVNYFIWRQNDCIRNAVNSIAQFYFSSKDLNHKNIEQIRKMFKDNDIDENTYNGFCRFGSSIIKHYNDGDEEWETIISPIFKENRNFINKTFIFN